MLIMLFPASANYRNLRCISESYLYVGGVLGIVILAAPIYLIPRIGTTSTLMAIILGQSIIALLIDQFGILSSPKIEINFPRSMGVLLVIIGASLVGRGSFPASVYAIPLIFCLEKFKAIPHPEYIQDTRIRTLLN